MFSIVPFLITANLSVNTDGPNAAYTSSVPVRISSCSVEPTLSYQRSGLENLIVIQPIGARLNIKFVNTNEKPISSVAFAVSDGNNPAARIKDVGTFSTGAEVVHSYESPIHNAGHVDCQVSSVTFSDGSSWMPSVSDDPR